VKKKKYYRKSPTLHPKAQKFITDLLALAFWSQFDDDDKRRRGRTVLQRGPEQLSVLPCAISFSTAECGFDLEAVRFVQIIDFEFSIFINWTAQIFLAQ